jgi:tetratricopeptide (TPR) repeat protein
MVAFIFLGALLSLGRLNGVLGSYSLEFKEGTNKTLISLLLGVIALVVVGLGWVGLERTLASFHFKQAIDLSNAETPNLNAIEEELGQAINFAPLDVYYRARAMANFSQAQEWANKTEGTPEENRAGFEGALGQSLEDSRAAVVANPASYLNWVSLGAIYSALVPLQIPGAYENAQYAYLEAQKRNPNNPEIPLLLAQLAINRGEIDQARSHIRSAITLKENYAEAYLLLARLEVSQNNLPVAIASSERLAALLPDNAGVHFELGLLKQANSDYMGAANSFSRALELEPEYANAKYYLALSLAKMGQIDQARALLEDLLAKEPGNAVIEEALELLR